MSYWFGGFRRRVRLMSLVFDRLFCMLLCRLLWLILCLWEIRFFLSVFLMKWVEFSWWFMCFWEVELCVFGDLCCESGFVVVLILNCRWLWMIMVLFFFLVYNIYYWLRIFLVCFDLRMDSILLSKWCLLCCFFKFVGVGMLCVYLLFCVVLMVRRCC